MGGFEQGVMERRVTCKKTGLRHTGGGDSPIPNPSPVLELVLHFHWRLLRRLVLDGVVGWLEEELGQLAWLWRLPADWVEDEAGQLA